MLLYCTFSFYHEMISFKKMLSKVTSVLFLRSKNKVTVTIQHIQHMKNLTKQCHFILFLKHMIIDN